MPQPSRSARHRGHAAISVEIYAISTTALGDRSRFCVLGGTRRSHDSRPPCGTGRHGWRRRSGCLSPRPARHPAPSASDGPARSLGHEHPHVLDTTRHHRSAERSQYERVVLRGKPFPRLSLGPEQGRWTRGGPWRRVRPQADPPLPPQPDVRYSTPMKLRLATAPPAALALLFSLTVGAPGMGAADRAVRPPAPGRARRRAGARLVHPAHGRQRGRDA